MSTCKLYLCQKKKKKKDFRVNSDSDLQFNQKRNIYFMINLIWKDSTKKKMHTIKYSLQDVLTGVEISIATCNGLLSYVHNIHSDSSHDTEASHAAATQWSDLGYGCWSGGEVLQRLHFYFSRRCVERSKTHLIRAFGKISLIWYIFAKH